MEIGHVYVLYSVTTVIFLPRAVLLSCVFEVHYAEVCVHFADAHTHSAGVRALGTSSGFGAITDSRRAWVHSKVI